MPDKKVLCYDCWKRGIDRAERYMQTYRADQHNRWNANQQSKQEYERLLGQIQALSEKIRYEKQQSGRDYYPDYVEDENDRSRLPYNYAIVKSMEKDLELLRKKKDSFLPQTYFPTSQPISASNSIQYYQNGTYYDSAAAKTHEEIEIEEARREAEKRERKEKEERERKRIQEEELARVKKERLARINNGELKQEDLQFIISDYKTILPEITNIGILKRIASETDNHKVIAYLLQLTEEDVLVSLSINQNITVQELSQLYQSEKPCLRKSIEGLNDFHSLQKFLLCQDIKSGTLTINEDTLPLLEDMYIGNFQLVGISEFCKHLY